MIGRPLRPLAGSRRRRGRWAILLLALAIAGHACSKVPVHRTLPPLNLDEPAFFPTLEAHAQAPIASFQVGGGVDVRNARFDGETQKNVVAPMLRAGLEGWFLPFLGVEASLLGELDGTCCDGVRSPLLRFSGGSASLTARSSRMTFSSVARSISVCTGCVTGMPERTTTLVDGNEARAWTAMPGRFSPLRLRMVTSIRFPSS